MEAIPVTDLAQALYSTRRTIYNRYKKLGYIVYVKGKGKGGRCAVVPVQYLQRERFLDLIKEYPSSHILSKSSDNLTSVLSKTERALSLQGNIPNCVKFSKENNSQGGDKGGDTGFEYLNGDKSIIYHNNAYYLSASKVVTLLSVKKNSVIIKAKRNHWSFIQVPDNGGLKKFYGLDNLDEDVKVRFLASIGKINSHRGTDGAEGFTHASPLATQGAGAYARANMDERIRVDMIERCLEEWQRYRKFSKRKNKDKADSDFVRLWNMDHGDDLKVSKSSLHRWYGDLKKGGKDGLVRQYSNRGKGKAAFSQGAKDYLSSIYFTEEKRDFDHCYQNLLWRAKEKGWNVPARVTVYRWIKSHPQDFTIRLREGHKAFDDYGFPTILRDPDSLNPGDLYVADGRIIDVSFGAGKAGMRLKVQAWMDGATGKFLSVTYPEDFNVQSVLDGLLEADSDHVGTVVQMDNGSDYLKAGRSKLASKDDVEEKLLSPIAQIHGPENVYFSIVHNAKAKYIERKFRDMARVHDKSHFNGYTAELLRKRPDKWIVDKSKGKFPSREELIETMNHYLFDIANNWAPNGSKSPNEMWDEWFEDHPKKRMPYEDLRHCLLPVSDKPYVVRKNGLIQFGKDGKDRRGRDKYRYYWDNWLSQLPAGKEFFIKYNANDDSKIWLYEPSGALIGEVPKYRYGKVSYLDGGELVGKHQEEKRHREKEIKKMKEDIDRRVEENLGKSLEPMDLMQRADIHEPPKVKYNKETGEIYEMVEFIRHKGSENTEKSLSEKYKENIDRMSDVHERMSQRLEVESDDESYWDRLAAAQDRIGI